MSTFIAVQQLIEHMVLYLRQVLLVLWLLAAKRWAEFQLAQLEIAKHPCNLRHIVRVYVQLLRHWHFFTPRGLFITLCGQCVLLAVIAQLSIYISPDTASLWTFHESRRMLSATGASQTSPVRDPRVVSPFNPRSALTSAFFCGRPTASSYDGFAGAPHAAYVHHDMHHDRFVVRTFGRGGTRVDHRRRTGIGRSTYETYCGASAEAHRTTPLAPSPFDRGEENWQLGSRSPSAQQRPTSSTFDFRLRRLAVPQPSATAAGKSGAAVADFTRADQGLRTHYRRHTRDELLDQHRHMDFIYSYVNGSDITRSFLKPYAKSALCSSGTVAMQIMWSALQSRNVSGLSEETVSEDEFSRHATSFLFSSSGSPCSLLTLYASVITRSGAVTRVLNSMERHFRATHQHTVPISDDPRSPEKELTARELLRTLAIARGNEHADFIDADSDELRHSMRGLLHHTRHWHRGRLSVVTPHANVPQWLNQSKNFFLRALLADAAAQLRDDTRDAADVPSTAEHRYVREAHTQQLHYTRIHVVDQRALMPPAPLTTVNSFVIEPFVYRLRNCSAVYMYMNDDYLVMKDVDVTDFVNAYSGPVLRLARPVAIEAGSDLDAFRRTLLSNLYFTQRELDKLVADQEVLKQPVFEKENHGVLHAAADGSVAPQGVIRADGAAFTAAIRIEEVKEQFDEAAILTQRHTVGKALMNAETCPTDMVSIGDAARCEPPLISLDGESSWVADAAGRFSLLPSFNVTTFPSFVSGATQTPSIVNWGSRVLRRAAADIVAPQVKTKKSTSVQRTSRHGTSSTAEMQRRFSGHVREVEKAFQDTRGAEQHFSVSAGKLASALEEWRSAVAVVELSTHHAMKTRPRLRKFRVRLDSHAPFIQCRNMWKYLHKRYAPEMDFNLLAAHKRSATDLLPPFTHTAHMLRHPWAGSRQYIPYLMAKEAWRLRMAEGGGEKEGTAAPMFPVVDVALDNEDGCAPATYIGEELNAAAYEEFDDSMERNHRRMARIRTYPHTTPFTNINSKFSSNRIGGVLRNFLEELFPAPMLLEKHWQSSNDDASSTEELRVALPLEQHGFNASADDAPTALPPRHNYTLLNLEATYKKLMRLPLILVSNDEEGFCPLLRSLRHALPAFKGLRVVQVLVPPADGRSLRTARAAQRHAYRNFLPVTRCTLPAGRLARVTLPAHSSTADIVAAGLRSARAGLPRRHWAAPALVALRGLRVARRAVQAVVLDARTLTGGATGFAQLPLPLALATPAELLAHEDFAEVLLRGDAHAAARPYVRLPSDTEAAVVASAMPSGEPASAAAASGSDYVASVLVLSQADAHARSVHWVYGASEHDLLSGMPLPYEGVEDMNAEVKWGF